MVEEMTVPIVRKGWSGGDHQLVSTIIQGMRTREGLHRDRARLFAGDVAHCPRKAVLHHHIDADTKVETAASGKLYMAIGSAVHAQVTDSLFAQGLLLFKEYRIPDLGLSLGGYVDAVVLFDGKVRNVEIKTCGRLPTEAKLEHRHQALMYEAVTGFLSIVLYVSRTVASWDGKVQMRAIELNATPEERDQVIRSAATAHYYSAAGVMPLIPSYLKSKADCTYCPFGEICWGSVNAPISQPSLPQRELLNEQVARHVEAVKRNSTERTNGILNHILLHGTVHAKRVLDDTEWSGLL